MYEPEFFNPIPDWAGRDAYSIELTFNDAAYNKDIFYFCHVRATMPVLSARCESHYITTVGKY